MESEEGDDAAFVGVEEFAMVMEGIKKAKRGAMKERGDEPGSSSLPAATLGVVLALLFTACWLPARLYAETPMTVERDRDKTVYTIGSNSRINQEEAAERDKAWDMLRNSGVAVDERKGRAQGHEERPSPRR